MSQVTSQGSSGSSAPLRRRLTTVPTRRSSASATVHKPWPNTLLQLLPFMLLLSWRTFCTAPVIEYVVSAPVIDHVAPALVLSDFLELAVPVDQVVQVPQVQIIEKTALTDQGTQTAESLELHPFVMWHSRREVTSPCRICPPIRVRTPVAEAPGVMGEHVLPALVVKCVAPAAPAPVAEIVAPAPVVTYTAPTPAVDSPPAVTNAASCCSGRVCCSSACRRIRCSSARCDLRSAGPCWRCACSRHRARGADASRRLRRHAHGDPQRLPPVRAEDSRCPTAGTQRPYSSRGLGTFSARTLAGRGARYLLSQCCTFSARHQEGQEGQAQALMWTVHELATACPGRYINSGPPPPALLLSFVICGRRVFPEVRRWHLRRLARQRCVAPPRPKGIGECMTEVFTALTFSRRWLHLSRSIRWGLKDRSCHDAVPSTVILRLSFAFSFAFQRACTVCGDPGYFVSVCFETHNRHREGLWRRCVPQWPHLRESRIASNNSPFGFGWSRPHEVLADSRHWSRGPPATPSRNASLSALPRWRSATLRSFVPLC